MVVGLGSASAPFTTRRIHPTSQTASSVAHRSPSCQQQQMAWANCDLKASSSFLLLRSERKEFGIDLSGSEGSSTISGFRVYCTGRSCPLKWRAGFLRSAATDRWRRLAWHFCVRNVACRIWIPSPRTPLSSSWTVLTTTRSLKKDSPQNSKVLSSPSSPDGGPELELANSSRGSKPASSKRSVRTIKSSSISNKGRQRAIKGEESLSAGKSNNFGTKPITQVVEKNDHERSGNASGAGRQSSLYGMKNSLKQSGGTTVVAGSDTPELKSPKANGKLSKDPDFITRKNFSRKAATSATVVSDKPRDSAGFNLSPPSHSTTSSMQNSINQNMDAGETKLKQRTDKKPKKKHFPVEAMLRRNLNMCSKEGDVLRALEIYKQSIAEGIVKWNQYNFNILLYLCSSAALGTLTARKSGTDRAESDRLNFESTEQNLDGTGTIESRNGATFKQQSGSTIEEVKIGDGAVTTTTVVLSQEVMELASQRGFEIFEDMKKQQVPPNEATLTAVARLAVKRGDGDLAFQMVKQMADMDIAPKLRSYSPALVTFCKSKAVEKAFEVDAHMVAAGVQPEEPELRALLQLCVELGLEKDVYSLLHRLRARVRALSPSTISSIEEWFSGQAGASAGVEAEPPEISSLEQAMAAGGGGWHGLGWLGTGEWKLKWTTVDSQGFCFSCRKQLVTIDLDPKETEKFAQSVSELAFARESKPNDFKRFQDWLDRYGPFDAIIDGANVGLYNQNFSQGGFNFFQLNAVAKAAQDRGLVTKPPLIVLHHARTKFGAANSPLGQQVLKRLSSSNTLYTTPNGSNDDWYWLYAAVRNKCLLITNDEMRDHLFQLLGSDFFPRWKERHQVRFSATSRGPQFHLPPPYSLVIQESEDGSWHIPKSGVNDVDTPHEWLCITRQGLSLDNTSSPVSGLTTPAEDLTRKMPTSHDIGLTVQKVHSSPKSDSAESDGTSVVSSRPKRLRMPSPSTTLRKIRAADKKSTSGPIMFDI